MEIIVQLLIELAAVIREVALMNWWSFAFLAYALFIFLLLSVFIVLCLYEAFIAWLRMRHDHLRS